MKESDFCKICRYYLYLEEVSVVDDEKGDKEVTKKELRRVCRNCGYQEQMKGGLILEIDLKEKTSEGYKILMNEFTKDDPTLPPRAQLWLLPRPRAAREGGARHLHSV